MTRPMKIGMKMKATTTGKMTDFGTSFESLFLQQMQNQQMFIDKGQYDKYKDDKTNTVPVDDIGLFSYNIQQLMSEIGEVLDADKRWKNFRNEKNDSNGKLEEIADCFIVMMNIAMFSGFNGTDVARAIAEKIMKVQGRIFEK